MLLRRSALCLLGLLATACDVTIEQRAPVPTRYLIGPPGEGLTNRPTLDLRALKTSEKLRRKTAWGILEEILSPSPAARDKHVLLPLFLKNIDRQDLQIIIPLFFDKLRSNRNLSSETAAETALSKFTNELEQIPAWTPERFKEWRSSLLSPEQQLGSFGILRALYTRSLIKSILQDYDTVSICPKTVILKDDEDLRDKDNFTLCFRKELPTQSLTVKTSWHRADLAPGVPVYASDEDAFAKRLRSEDWSEPDSYTLPPPSDIFTIALADGTKFYLTGLHVASKLLREWYWITLWWSADPSKDYGHDRPPEGYLATSQWRNYKMCTVVSYEDTVPTDVDNVAMKKNQDTFQSKFPGRSWCSNPYLEHGPHNAASNCIGCHQHAGTEKKQEAILTEEQDGKYARLDRIRRNFPTDYVYGITTGADNIASRLRAHGTTSK